LIVKEHVTIAVTVPTVWNMLHSYLTQNPSLSLGQLRTVYVGGSALPPSQYDYFQDVQHVQILQGFGMTEMSPLGTLSHAKGFKPQSVDASRSTSLAQGRPVFGFNMKIVNDEGTDLPHDGVAIGRLKVKGPAVARSYFKNEDAERFDEGGWFDTGDVGRIDAAGYLRLTDRAKDLIKSGGEWISSIELENMAMGCEGVAQAAAIGIPHPKWDERPLLVVVRKQDSEVTATSVLKHLEGKIAKWWIPDAVEFVDSLPMTGTGKISKLLLRQQFKDYRL
jgi:fatty-acyl-CoA synthase